MNSSDKKKLIVFILAIKKLKFKIEDINIAMIDINAYCVVYYLKKTQIFTILMKDI